MKTSYVQAKIFSQITRDLKFWKESNKSNTIRFPKSGPYDLRLGYVQIPEWVNSMSQKGFLVKEQMQFSKSLLLLNDLGVFPIYHEKTQAGLCIIDNNGLKIFAAKYPQRIYPTFESIPPVVVKTLLFIENRELLNNDNPYRNPAIDWSRMGRAIMDMAVSLIYKDYSVPGGSTLATQLEKFRHSPDGITLTPLEKLRQITSASFRSYLDGEKTLKARKQIFLSYINSIPLAAIEKYGEVNGIGDGLWAWFESDFDEINKLLKNFDNKTAFIENQVDIAMAYRKVLSLMLAHRRPSSLLIKDREALQKLADNYLHMIASAGIISSDLRDIALKIRPEFRKEMSFNANGLSFPQWKTANLLRTRLSTDLNLNQLYALDRLDLTVQSTISMSTQENVIEVLRKLKDPSDPYVATLKGPYLLARGDPSGITYSFSLYENTPLGNLLRVRANSFDGPFNIDESTKLDLGSTAKLRTLVTYLEVIASLYQRYANVSKAELKKIIYGDIPADRLTQWAAAYFFNNKDYNLEKMLEAALERKYSANPGERFFTGSGMHSFANFHKTDDLKILTIKEAFSHSINLVFIRIMRDIVYHYIYQRLGTSVSHLENLEDSEIKHYLSLFADKEGRVFLSRFNSKYSGKKQDEVFELLVSGTHPYPPHLAAVYRYVKPDAGINEFLTFMTQHLPNSSISEDTIIKLYDSYAPSAYSLADRGYIVSIHPLELWIARYKYDHPNSTFSDVIKDSAEERQIVYHWLFKTRHKNAQLSRIRTILEIEAFQDIHQSWKKVGYPFDFLIPSYATSIGSSGDKPSALAELMGIISNGGMRYSTMRFQKLHFAEGTPFETLLDAKSSKGERVLPAEVANVIKKALINVVETGTAQRIKNAFRFTDGSIVEVGGKTGTGDHRYKTFGSYAQLISSRVVSRTAVFVFYIGEKFFGTVTAYVAGEEASNYTFTSALPVQILKILWPAIHPLIENG